MAAVSALTFKSTFKSTQTLNLTKVIELRELHINYGDTRNEIVVPQP